jgi:hypothetical protein
MEGNMASTVTLEGVKKAVFFPFKGEKWGLKLLIGSALILAVTYVPVLGLVALVPVYGYNAQIMKRVIVDDEDPSLPEWRDWGALFLDGIKLLGISLIYGLPALLLIGGGYAMFFIFDFATVFSAAAADSYSQYISQALLLNTLGMLAGIGIAMIGVMLALIVAFFVPTALGNSIARRKFRAAFNFKEWWHIFVTNLGGYLLVLALTIGLYSLLLLAVNLLYFTIVLCIFVPILTCIAAYLFSVIYYSLLAVAYRDAVRKIALRTI